MNCIVLGIDPAPSKESVEYDGEKWTKCCPEDLYQRVRSVKAPAIIAWDAPLSFNRSDFYGRCVDETAKKWAANKVKKGHHFKKGAVNACPFAALSHWAVTCEALGMPFGEIPPGCALAPKWPPKDSSQIAVIEVHPAVALGIWWLERKISTPLPRYKGTGPGPRAAVRTIIDSLGFRHEYGMNDALRSLKGANLTDDHLDSYVAYRIGMLFRDGRADWLGNWKDGGYVLPDSPITDDLRERYVMVQAKRLKERERKRLRSNH